MDFWRRMVSTQVLDGNASINLRLVSTSHSMIMEEEKLRMEEKIREIIQKLQMFNTTNWDLNGWQIHKEHSCQDLMTLFFLGFTGDLEMILVVLFHRDLDDINIICFKDLILELKELLQQYIAHRWIFEPIKEIINTKNQTFALFTSRQQQCERYLLRLELLSANGSCGDGVESVRPIIANFKLMMQGIGYNIGYPVVCDFDYYNHLGIPIPIFWKINKETLAFFKRVIEHTLKTEAESYGNHSCDNETRWSSTHYFFKFPISLIDDMMIFLDALHREFICINSSIRLV